MKVVKFGGSSLASAEAILRARDIVLADPKRTFVIVSAPGKCKEFDRKITDLLIDAATELAFAEKSESLKKVFTRFNQLASGIGVNIGSEIKRVREEIEINRKQHDFIVSRGEYLMAIMFARLLSFKFIDAAKYVVIKPNGRFNEAFTRTKFMRCIGKNEKIVMGGFYGQSERNGQLTVFPRGGSDYSGAIAAVCMGAEIFEIWTDTHGVQTANPAIIKNTQTLPHLDFGTIHKLSEAGASVVCPNCLPLLRRHNLTLRIDSTFDPFKRFTLITREKANSRYFCITYNICQNINKDTAEIIVMFSRIEIKPEKLKKLLKDIEVYLVGFSKKSFSLLAPVQNMETVVSRLHAFLSEQQVY